jgi:hypothetical protein
LSIAFVGSFIFERHNEREDHMPRLREIPKNKATGTPGTWWTVFALVLHIYAVAAIDRALQGAAGSTVLQGS